MTLVMAWIRNVKGCEELVFASDSRLSCGNRWDQCPKLMLLPRTDCALAFAGDTAYAYPLMIQTSAAISSYVRARDRAMDICDYRGYLLRYYNELKDALRDNVDAEAFHNNEFIFGGYSWIKKKFCMWKFHYGNYEDRIVKESIKHKLCGVGYIMFAGDKAYDAKVRLINLLRARYPDDKPEGFDMEPFEVLRDMLEESTINDTIGGAPQIIKVYQHMNCRPIGVYWPRKVEDIKENRTLFGRRLGTDETTDVWFMDPMTFITMLT